MTVQRDGRNWWRAAAACRGRVRLFYAEDSASRQIAVAVCRGCPVRVQCEADARAYEVEGRHFGVRAGFTAAERRGWDD